MTEEIAIRIAEALESIDFAIRIGMFLMISFGVALAVLGIFKN